MGRIPAQRFTTWTRFALFSIFWLFTVSGVRGQSNYQTIYSFGNIDPSGSVPKASLIVGGDGMLYGTTSAGGTNGLGCVFKMNRDGSGYSELHDFAGVGGDGAQPVAALLLGMDGALYAC